MNRNTINKMIDCSDDFIDGEPFELIRDDIIGITRKDWICGTEYYNRLQLIALFEIVDLGDCGCLDDDDDGEYPISVQAALMVHPKFFSKIYVDDFIEECALKDGKYPAWEALYDAYAYGGGVPVNMESVSSSKKCDVDSKVNEDPNFGTYRRFKTMDDADKYIREVHCHNVNAVMGLIGFYLDRGVNRIGTTGWDVIYHMTEGRELFKPAFDRLKGSE